ncbi:MAG: signal recognition particle-docking protein FtsY, partial [Shewanella sp.]|nr:signal recognition particle-docking protein FtsY [Shewanella sp.]
MAKKGFFSWFRKDKSQDEVVEQTPVSTPSQTEQAEALAKQQAEEARLAAEKAAAEQALADKLAADKLAAEKAEAERVAAEQAAKAQAEAQRVAE